MKAIPTLYKNIVFRSRLEAKWAAFFDLAQWHWDYEPIDLNGWIPDFQIINKQNKAILVEVKPITDLNREFTDKIDKANNNQYEVLLVGSTLPKELDQIYIGWLYELGINSWARAPFCFYKETPNLLDFTHEYGYFSGRISGNYDGGSYGIDSDRASKRAEIFWAIASNSTQWKP